MAAAMTATGVDDALAAQFKSLGGLPLGLVLLVVVTVIVLTGELAGNVAAATAMMPILLAAAGPMGVDPVLLVFAATFAVSCGFMLPVATPPNAIVFATGRIGLPRMLRAGLALDLTGIAVITGVMWALGPTLLQWAGLAR
jgi:solute carrier family 13 (sodium-dependent dicarboxylate transporter), member 2/3/5